MTTLVLRALAAFLVLPGVVAFAVPLLWIRPSGTPFSSLRGGLPLLAGTALLLWCALEFYRRGRGTLAPWDPPRALVIAGPYRYSRNPMYVGVLLILIGWALAFASTALAAYAAVMAIVFHLRVLWFEESYLAETYPAAWDAYRRRVPRWLGPGRRAIAPPRSGDGR